MSRVFMLKPADGIEGVKEAILTAVKDAGPNACPPMVIGVGIEGTTTVLAVNINTFPTHIAGLPVAINICCHVNRHSIREI